VTGPFEVPSLQGGLFDRRGFALPVVLFGLIGISLLAITALITATSESASSSAHQQATRQLYATESALDRYLADEAEDLGGAALTGELAYTPPGGAPIMVEVVGLGTFPRAAGSRVYVYAVTARPPGGGRTLSVVVTDSVPDPTRPPFHLRAAVTVAGSLVVGVDDVHLAAGPEACDLSGVGGPVTRSGDPDDLLREVFGTQNLGDVAATIPRELWRDGYSSSGWMRDALAHPGGVAVVDARGGTFTVAAGSYSGLLIVLNGGIQLTDTITYAGVILAEGPLQVRGEVEVRGALMSLGRVPGRPEGMPSEIGSGARITFDGCSVESSGRVYRDLTTRTRLHEPRRVGSWMEVVR
jgi:hypothetical protein